MPEYYLGEYSFSEDGYSGYYPNGYGMQVDKNYYMASYCKITDPYKNHPIFNFRLLERVEYDKSKYIGYYRDGCRDGYGCSHDVTNKAIYREGIWSNDNFTGIGVEYSVHTINTKTGLINNEINYEQSIRLGFMDNNNKKIVKDFTVTGKSVNGYGQINSDLTHKYYKIPENENLCVTCSDALSKFVSTKTILNTRKKRFSGIILEKKKSDFENCGCEFCKYVIDNNLFKI